MYKPNVKSWSRRDDASNFAGDPSTAASVQGSPNPALNRDQVAASDAGSRNAPAVAKINAVNRISVVSSILEFLSSPQAQEAFTPPRRETNSQTGERTQQLVIPPAHVTTGSFTDAHGDACGVVTFAVTAAQEEDVHQFFRRATYALCNFCNMYLLPVFLSRELAEVQGCEASESIKKTFGLSLRLRTQTGNCAARDLVHHILHEVTLNGRCMLFFMPGNAILHEILALSLQEPTAVCTIALYAEISSNLLTAEHLEFVQGNAQALRAMLQASQVLQMYRYLLATDIGGKQVESDLQMQQFVSRTPYNLGATCALSAGPPRPWSFGGTCDPMLMGYIFTYGKHASSLGSCAFPLTEKVVRAHTIALHKIRGDLLYVQELPDVFPYHLAVDSNIQADNGIMSRLTELGVCCQEPDAASRRLAFSVVKNDPNSEPSVAHLAKFINLVSSCRQLCNREFTILPGVCFQANRECDLRSQSSGKSRWALLECVLRERQPTLATTQRVEEELQFIFSSTTGQSSLMCAVGSFLPVVRSTSAALNTLVECVVFVGEKEREVGRIAAGATVRVNPEFEPVPGASAAAFAHAMEETHPVVPTLQPHDVASNHSVPSSDARAGGGVLLSRANSEPALMRSVTSLVRSQSLTDVAPGNALRKMQQQNTSYLYCPVVQSRVGIFGRTRDDAQSMPAVCQDTTGQPEGVLASLASMARRVINALTPSYDEPSESPDSSAKDPTVHDERAAHTPESEAYTRWVEQQLRMDGNSVRYFGAPTRSSQVLEMRPGAEDRDSPMCPPVRGALLALLASTSCKIFIISTLAAVLIAAIYVGVIRSRCATCLASCDIAVASGLPCTLILILLCSITAECLLRRDRQQNTLQESSVAPAVPITLGAAR